MGPRMTGAGAPPLTGLVVVDFTRILAGPLCTMLLAELGAEVTKIERPDGGDDTRAWGPPFVGEDAAYYLSVNRGKKSITLDLSDPVDVATARQLASTADVLVENFRSGVMTRFGLDYESLARTNPGLVYCSVPAFASTDSPKPGYDLLMQAACGLMSITGEEDRPVKTGVAILDVVTGLYATTGILAALAARSSTGRGQHVKVGLFEASVSALMNQGANYLMGGVVPRPAGNAHPSIVPYQVFHGSDADFVLAAGNDKLFRLTAELVGRQDLARDERFVTNADRVAHREELVGMLQEQFARQPAAHWVSRCDAYGVPASLVRTLDQVFASPEGQTTVGVIDDPTRGPLRYVRTPIELTATPLRHASPAPLLGEHSEQIIAALRAAQPLRLVDTDAADPDFEQERSHG